MLLMHYSTEYLPVFLLELEIKKILTSFILWNSHTTITPQDLLFIDVKLKLVWGYQEKMFQGSQFPTKISKSSNVSPNTDQL